MSKWWALPAALVVAGVALAFVDPRYGVALLFAAVVVATVVLSVTSASGTLRLRPRVDEDGIAWLDRRGQVVESTRWEDIERVRAWTRLLWMGDGTARYQHHLDVVTQPHEHVRRTRHRKRSTPSLDELLAQMGKNGVPVEDDRRFGMIESVRRGR